MYSTKNFCNVSAFINNEVGVNSPIGEMTSHGLTYSREIATFHSATIEGYDLINLSSRDEDTRVTMDRSTIEQAIALVDTAVRYTLGTSGQLYQDEAHRVIVATAELVGAHYVETGGMINSGRFWVPRYIKWANSNDTGRENEHIVWLSIDDFLQDYPDYEIVVVPPVDNLDSFFFPGSVVESTLSAITPTQMIERAEEAKGESPTTYRRSDAYTYMDPANSGRRIEVYWQILGYGAAGNDPDLIRDQMVNYILENSSRPREDWAIIFPDIFRRTELVFVPFWDKYASAARTYDHGVYSPIINNREIINQVMLGALGYPRNHVETNTELFGFPYRSLSIAVVGHIENRDGKFCLSDHYGDFINAGLSSTDAGRMSVPTQEWAVKMSELILLAEEWSIATRLPRGVYRVVREGKTFISTTINRVLMLVLVKRDATVQGN